MESSHQNMKNNWVFIAFSRPFISSLRHSQYSAQNELRRSRWYTQAPVLQY